MNRLTLSLGLPRLARCPICDRMLCGPAIVFLRQTAICSGCFRSTPDNICQRVADLAHNNDFVDGWSIDRGLIFWCPKPGQHLFPQAPSVKTP